MPLTGIAGLAVAGLLHASWNLLVKRSTDKQVFLWLCLAVASGPLLVLAIVLYQPIPWPGWLPALLAGGAEALYFLLLGGAYGRGDLSLVYPLARGSAPLFAAVFALLFLGEQVTGPGRLGIALIGLGIYTLHLRTLAPRGWLAPLQSLRTRPSQLALLTGLTIAGYSVLDKAALGYFPPLLYLPLVFLLPLAMLAPYMLSARRSALRAEWSRQRRQIVVVATLMPLTYLLVLWTLTTTNVSYVAAVREVAVVPAALFGTLLLREPFGRSKLLGAGLIFAGIVAVAVAQ